MDVKQKSKRMQKRIAHNRMMRNLLLTGAMLLIVVLFLVINLLVRDKEYSDSENRSLAQRPELSLSAIADGSYFSGLSSHYSDQFFARDKWISLNLARSSAVGYKENGGVYLGKNGYLMMKPAEKDEVALPATENAMNTFHALHQNINTYLMVVPTASQILTQYLPKNAPVYDQISDIQTLDQDLASSIVLLDAISPLQAHSEEDIYYHTDHHWTSYGAYTVFQSIAPAMQLDTANVNYTTYTVSDRFEGTLSSKSGSHKYYDSVEIYKADSMDNAYYVMYDGSSEKICSIYNSSCLDQKDKYTVFFGGNHPLVEIRTTNNNNRSLLLFKDSYANSFVQFLLPYFENIIMVDPRYYYDNVEQLIGSYNVTDVLYLFSADTFLTDSSLADVLNAAIESATGSKDDAPAPAFPAQNEVSAETENEDTEAAEAVTEESGAEEESPEETDASEESEETA